MTVSVIGLDLSLAGTGMARADSAGNTACWTIATEGKNTDGYPERLARLLTIRRQIAAGIPFGVDLVVMEGPSYASQGAGTWDRAGLWWSVYEGLTSAGVPLAVAPPKCRALYATGKGQAKKEVVFAAAVRRFGGYPISNNNEADAVVLAEIGLRHLGASLVDVPATHARALTGVAWPTRT